jgi:hypothetical protein
MPSLATMAMHTIEYPVKSIRACTVAIQSGVFGTCKVKVRLPGANLYLYSCFRRSVLLFLASIYLHFPLL